MTALLHNSQRVSASASLRLCAANHLEGKGRPPTVAAFTAAPKRKEPQGITRLLKPKAGARTNVAGSWTAASHRGWAVDSFQVTVAKLWANHFGAVEVRPRFGVSIAHHAARQERSDHFGFEKFFDSGVKPSFTLSLGSGTVILEVGRAGKIDRCVHWVISLFAFCCPGGSLPIRSVLIDRDQILADFREAVKYIIPNDFNQRTICLD
jgi:hypothetical protein